MFRFKLCFILCTGLQLGAAIPSEHFEINAKSNKVDERKAGSFLVSGGKNPLGTNRGHYKYNRDLDAWIRLYPVPASWFDARQQCQDHDASLVLATSNEARHALKRELFAQDVVSDVFTGVASSGNSCTALSPTGSLRTVECTDKLPFFCYKEPRNKCGPKDNGYGYDARTGSCYKFRATALDWRAALLSCHEEGGHLVVINSEVESTVLRGIFDDKKNTVTGTSNVNYVLVGSKKWSDGVWATINGDTIDEAGFSLWAAGEPNNDGGDEYCGSIFLQDGLYNDLSCKRPSAYICEITP